MILKRRTVKLPTIDLFRLYILFSDADHALIFRRFGPLFRFIKKSACRHIHACMRSFNEQNKELILLSIIT